MLASGDGRLVTKDELMNTVWPHTVVEENNIQVHLSALRKALGEDRDCIVTVPGRGYRLMQRRAAALPSKSALPGQTLRRLPSFPTGLVGRDAAIAQVRTALDSTPVLTLTGAGGIGKTTLSIAVAHEIAEAHPDFVCFVELAALTDRQSILASIAQSCRLSLDGDFPSIEAIAATLAHTPRTLFLDNAEQAIAHVAEIVETLTDGNPALRVLVTSREPLRIAQERTIRVGPLEVPARDATEHEVLAQSAVHLFLARIGALGGKTSFDRKETLTAGEICRRLDGIPLAIELAAARVFSLGIEGVYQRLDDRMSILTAGYRTALPRHQTLRATFDWSFTLLDPGAQALFRRLAMFGGVFTLEAMCAVACGSGLTMGAAIDGIGELVAKSMVNVSFDGPVAKYRMNESTRAYALELLHAEDETQEIASRIARYFTSRFDAGAGRTGSVQLVEGSSDLQQTLDDARAASEWAFSSGGDLHLAVELTSTLTGVLLGNCLIEECGTRAERAVSALNELPPRSIDVVSEMRVRAALAATLPNLCGPMGRSWKLWNEVLDLAISSGNDEFQARAYWGLWNAALYGGNVHDAIDHALSFQTFAQDHGHAWQETLTSLLAAVAQHCAGQHDHAKSRIEEAMQHLAVHPHEAEQITSFAVDPLAICYGTLARIVWLQGDAEEALAYVDKGVNLITPETMEPWLTHVLGVVAVPIALLSGDLRRGRCYLQIMRSQTALHGFMIWREYSDCLAAYCDLLEGESERGLPVLEASLDALIARGFRRLITPIVVACAEGLIAVGRFADASMRLHDALNFCRRHGKLFFLPEVWRALGLLAQARARLESHASEAWRDARNEARSCFREAIQLSQQQGARMLELRATVAMARQLYEHEQWAGALALLKNLSARFERSSRSPDVKALFELIDALHVRRAEPVENGASDVARDRQATGVTSLA
ncbi:winged helix-turn-helix domain-containing protein [Paraburkholderia hospita]|uniref:winged helix-turn-helix domain-containing protein n=1 Tax=Paraburkholderia hospita TaxID=169430 RepID=UPI00131A0469|nr:winged helix-turn-helix domain-containing protein [Paraburkholderia hospita]